MTFQTFTRSALVCAVLATTSVWAQAQSIVMSSTTSTEQSGLFAHLLPAFKKASGIDIKVVALGTGQALDMGTPVDTMSAWMAQATRKVLKAQAFFLSQKLLQLPTSLKQ